MEGQITRNPKDETQTSDSAAGATFSVQPLEITINQPPNHLEMLEDSNTNTLQLESLKSDSGWGRYGVSKNWNFRGEGWREFLKILLGNSKWEREGRNRRRERGLFDQSCGATSTPGRGGRVAHTGAEGAPGRGAHGLNHGQPMWPTAWAVLSRAPSVRRPVSRASELRIRIRFRITNRDSLTHENDYTNLKNGWEIISEIIDEVNSTNENEKQRSYIVWTRN